MDNFSFIRLYDDKFCLDAEIQMLLLCVNNFKLSQYEIDEINSFQKLIMIDNDNNILKHFADTNIMEKLIEIKYSKFFDWEHYEF